MHTFSMWYGVNNIQGQLKIPSTLFRFPESMWSLYYTNYFHIHRLFNVRLGEVIAKFNQKVLGVPDFTNSVLHDSANGLCTGNLI